MQFKALHSSSPYIQIHTKIPILNKQQSTLPPRNSPFNINFNHCPQTPLNFCVPKRITQRISRKLRCISATPELEALDPESEITISNQNGCNMSSQMQEIRISNVNNSQISSETTEMVETTSGSLANQGLWEQMVEIIKFSGPATGIWICGPLMSLIDTAVIGQGSSLELAALGPGTVLCDYLGFVFMFLSVATSNMVATSLARKDEDQVQHQISMLIFLGLASGVLMLILTKLFGAWALTAFVGPKNVHLVPAADTYIQIRALAWPAILVGSIAQSASLGMKDSLGPLKALVIASAINGIGDIVLCTFLGYGIAGAAWATAASQVVAAYTMVDSLNKKGYNGFSILIPSVTELQEVFSIAAPVFITMISKVGFYALMIYFATSMGTISVAAHQVLAQIFSMCSVWGEPLSQTAQSFMPELLFGIDRSIIKARALLRSLLIIGALIGLVLGAVATSIPWLFPNFFTPDPAVIAEMHKVWIFFFLALSITPCILPCEGTLLAGRDLKFISSSMTACFLMGALCLKVMANQGLGIVGCWAALVGFQWARFILSFRRLLSPNGLLYSKDLRFWFAELKAA